jgi:prepilin signal peptidase PulO-like enzyme (type II secretory pathway)
MIAVSFFSPFISGMIGLVLGTALGLIARHAVQHRGQKGMENRQWVWALPVVTAISTSVLCAGLSLWSTFDAVLSNGMLASSSIASMVVVALLVAAAAADLCGRIIPNELIVVGAIFALVFQFWNSLLTPAVLTAIGCGFGGLGIRRISRHLMGRDGLGMGDVKLVTMLALWMGPSVLWTAYLAVLFAAMFGTHLLITRSGTRTSHLPFGPFMLIGFLLHDVIPLSQILTVFP